MTEKRFSYNVNKNTIQYDKKFIAYVNCVDGVRIANKLNELNEEIQRFEIDLEDMVNIKNKYKKEREDYYEMFLDVKKENEKLKQLLLQFYTEDEINAEMI